VKPRPRRPGARRAAVRRVLATLALCAAASACTADGRHRILVALFEDVPDAGSDPTTAVVVRRPRRPPPPTPPPTPTPLPAADADAAAFRTWDDVLLRLPKNHVGDPDWVRALDSGMIAPRPGIAPEAAAEDVLDLETEMTAPSAPALSVVFSHSTHTAWLSCANCHPAPFAMEAGAAAAGSGDIHDDQHCGACHGKVAFGIADGCTLCHLRRLPRDSADHIDWSEALASHAITPGDGPRRAATPSSPLDLDIEYAAAAQPAFRSLFSHRTHTQWLSCANCHPRLFPEGPDRLGGTDLHSRQRCGACHGAVAFGQTEGCKRCHPAFEQSRHHHNSLDLDVPAPARPGAVFSHKIHTPWVECASCHGDLYAAAPATAGTTAADFYGGRYCSQCHGDVARDLVARCQPCHAADHDT
jgi:c(7)-type cytochrome triheme protein